MTKLSNDNLETTQLPGGFVFSAQSLENLESSEYTLVGLVLDMSGSVDGFKNEMTECVKQVVQACQKSPRSENLMVRVVKFNNSVDEFHGFRMLSSVSESDYNDLYNRIYGCTSLYDAVYSSIEATTAYGETLSKQGIMNNAIIFIVTDGQDNNSKFGPDSIKKLIDKVRKSECVESVLTVLIGVTGGDKSLSDYLENLKDSSGMDQYVDITNANKSTLAQLATFVSRSVSSQSQALGSGGPSKTLMF